MFLLLLKKFNLRFFWLNVSAVILFAFLYWIQDIFITRNQKLAEELHLLDKNRTSDTYSNKTSTFAYYLWFSLITQTTVGYGGTINSVSGKPVSYIESPNRLIKFLNMLQLLSILLILSIA